MPRDEKKRIKTDAADSARPGLNPAFAGLEITGLPAASEPVSDSPAPSAEKPGAVWKMGRVVLRRETAHRGGKTVIVVYDFGAHLPLTVIEQVAKKVRAACGCGGSVKGRTVEIQGDQAERIRRVLESEGFQVAGIR